MLVDTKGWTLADHMKSPSTRVTTFCLCSPLAAALSLSSTHLGTRCAFWFCMCLFLFASELVDYLPLM
jgi:hypothetical protein